MKFKKLIAMLLCALALTGCGLFTDGETGKGNEAIVLAEDYKITDPEDLDFDTRYVLYGDASNATLQLYASMGITIDEAYVIIYEKDGKAIAEYDYYAFADETSATTFLGVAVGMELEGLIGKNVQTQDMIDATIAMMISGGAMAGETAEDYAKMYETAYGYVLQK